MPVIAVSAHPPLPDGFYATNNQFQMNGPKGFSELRILDDHSIFVRMDLPGVPGDGLRYSIDQSNKALLVQAVAPKSDESDSSGRHYVFAMGPDCECCEISDVCADMLDGVLRLTLSKRRIHEAGPEPEHQSTSCLEPAWKGPFREPNPNEPAWTGPFLEPNPNVVQGPNTAYESKRLPNGGLYVRVDMPGVPEERFKVFVERNLILVTGNAPAKGFDSSGRDYSGTVAFLACSRIVHALRIKIGGFPCLLPDSPCPEDQDRQGRRRDSSHHPTRIIWLD